MDVPWLKLVNKALTAAGVLHSFAKYAATVIRRLFLVDQKIDGQEIENLVAYIKMFDAYAKLMRRAGATQPEIQAAMGLLLTPRLRSYLQARGIIETGKTALVEELRSSVVESCTVVSPPLSPQAERGLMQFAPEDAHHKMRLDDPER